MEFCRVHNSHIKTCFDRAAKSYDLYNQTQVSVGCDLISAIIQRQNSFKSVLDLGCGSGLITQKLAYQISCAEFLALDISHELISLAQDRLKDSNVSFLHSDYDVYDIQHETFDLIFSNMALQWSSNLSILLLRLSKALSRTGILAFSIPLAGTFCELNSHARNPYVTHEDLLLKFKDLELNCQLSFTKQYVNEYDSPLAALRAIKATGANYLYAKNAKTLRSARHLRDIYVGNHDFPTLTYHIGYYFLQKG
jgi:malonyl-CoA O-methyltransferase